MIPVITIDGPSGSGKGTISQIVAQRLGWNLLDSGALYRLLALAAHQAGISLHDEPALAALAKKLDVQFVASTEGQSVAQNQVLLEGQDAGEILRSEQCGNDASKVAALPAVRAALLGRQRDFRATPGLVADGRDMGSVIFPDADLKIFLTASASMRAHRRYKQLKDKGVNVSISNLVEEIAERDVRDSTRSVAPMAPAPDAVVLDSSDLTIEQVVARVMDLWRERARP
ncbi:MAG: (d)CMP kinase [Gammaproteobacteria bacterium]